MQVTTRQALFVYRNVEACSCKHCCPRRARSITYSECVCSLRYPACIVQAPYCHLSSARPNNIFPHYLKRRNFLKEVIEHKFFVCHFLYSFCLKHFFILRRTERDINKWMLVFMYSTRYSCQILLNTEFSRQIFEKFSYIKFHENPGGGSRAVQRGRSARHDEAISRLSQFCEGAWWVTHELLPAKKRLEVVVTAFSLEFQSCSRCVIALRYEKFPTFRPFLGGLDHGVRFEMSAVMHMATAPLPRSVVTSLW